MDIRQITPTYSVTPQIEPQDLAAIAAAGFKTVICNRPDTENPPPLQAAAMQSAADAAGLAFVYNPISHGALTENAVEEQADAIAGSDGAVLAYCASGTRSTIIWGLGAAPETGAAGVVEAAAAAGYDIGHMRALFEAAASRGAD